VLSSTSKARAESTASGVHIECTVVSSVVSPPPVEEEEEGELVEPELQVDSTAAVDMDKKSEVDMDTDKREMPGTPVRVQTPVRSASSTSLRASASLTDVKQEPLQRPQTPVQASPAKQQQPPFSEVLSTTPPSIPHSTTTGLAGLAHESLFNGMLYYFKSPRNIYLLCTRSIYR
jgi:hypothetical protein